MAAASLTVVYAGVSGRIYSINGYASDATNVLVKLDEAKIAVAGSADGYKVKEQGSIVDVVFTSDLATPTHVQVQRNGGVTGDILDVTAILASVVNRPSIRIPYRVGDEIKLMQIA